MNIVKFTMILLILSMIVATLRIIYNVYIDNYRKHYNQGLDNDSSF